jgi:DNA-binding response OmpR family regulator
MRLGADLESEPTHPGSVHFHREGQREMNILDEFLEQDVLRDNILVIGERDTGRQLREMLAGAGFRRVSVTVLDQARDIVSAEPVGIVLMEMTDPGQEELDVLRWLRRAQAPDEFLPVLVMTAGEDSANGSRALADGASDILNKPVVQRTLLARLRLVSAARFLHRRVGQLAGEVDRLLHDWSDAVEQERFLEEMTNTLSTALAQADRDHRPLAVIQIDVSEDLREGRTPCPPPDEALPAPVRLGDRTVTPRRGLGIATARSAELSAQALLREASVAAIRARRDHLGTPVLLDSRPRQSYQERQDVRSALRNARIRLAVDDGRTGERLHDLLRLVRFDLVKVDGSPARATTAVTTDAEAHSRRRDLAAVSESAHRFGIPVVAEGVESDQQASALVTLGCDLAQGHYYSGPLPAERATALLRPPGNPPVSLPTTS